MTKKQLLLLWISGYLLTACLPTPPLNDHASSMASVYHQISPWPKDKISVSSPSSGIRMPLTVLGHWITVGRNDKVYVPTYTTTFALHPNG